MSDHVTVIYEADSDGTIHTDDDIEGHRVSRQMFDSGRTNIVVHDEAGVEVRTIQYRVAHRPDRDPSEHTMTITTAAI